MTILLISTNAVAIATVLTIGLAFIAGTIKQPKPAGPTIEPEPERAYWTASDYYIYLNSLILSCRNPDELRSTMTLIEGYMNKKYRVPAPRSLRKDNYERLLISYCDKEYELETIPVELCKN